MTPTFYEYMAGFLKDTKAQDVVEIGSDPQLSLATAISPHCTRFHSVNFLEDHARIQGWYDFVTGLEGAANITLLSGDALELPRLISHADIIVLQNVLIDGRGGADTHLMWQYRRKERSFSPEEVAALWQRFDRAEVDAYRAFLQVAKPGYVVRFGRPEGEGIVQKVLVEHVGVDPHRIKKTNVLHDDTREVWDVYIIDNT